MGGANEISKVEGSEAPIEIKIKTLDSQTYTLQVNKRMPVPELKQQIASVTGVLSERQRLICRGRVLKDDQLLSAYHIEDGHTLHLVVGQPGPPSSGNLPNHPAPEPALNTSHGQRIQVAPGVVVETFDITDQGDGVLPDINRIVSAVLGAFGMNDMGTGNESVSGQARNFGGHERTMNASGMTASAQLQPEQAGGSLRGAFGFPTAISMGSLQPRVIPGSLTTLSQYLGHMRQEFGVNGGNTNDAHGAAIDGTQRRESDSASSSILQERLPTPELLAEVLLSTRDFLVGQTAESLLQLGTQLHNQSNVTDPVERLRTQSNAWRNGTLLQNLGAFLLELGRATMTLRMGSSVSDGVVNAGPAVFISQSGPNPLMVQPLPFQPGTAFGVVPSSTGQHGSISVNDGFVPRRIDIQIRRGSSTARENVNQEEDDGSQPPSALGNPELIFGGQTHVNQVQPTTSEGVAHIAESGARFLPLRTMVAAIPAQLGRLPGLGRFTQISSANLGDGRGFQAFREHHSSGSQTEQQQNSGELARDSNSTNAAVEQGSQQAPSRRFRFSVRSTGAPENHHPPGREVPSEVFQVLRSLYPGGEIHVEDLASQGTAAGPVTENAGTTSSAAGTMDQQEPERRVTEEGIFLSNLLREIMPIVSQFAGATPDVSTQPPNASEQRIAHQSSTKAQEDDAGTSHQQSDAEDDITPNSKRQKME
ncbi:hypothetical protein LguiB_024457 [Lonicera macranthoides]